MEIAEFVDGIIKDDYTPMGSFYGSLLYGMKVMDPGKIYLGVDLGSESAGEKDMSYSEAGWYDQFRQVQDMEYEHERHLRYMSSRLRDVTAELMSTKRQVEHEATHDSTPVANSDWAKAQIEFFEVTHPEDYTKIRRQHEGCLRDCVSNHVLREINK